MWSVTLKVPHRTIGTNFVPKEPRDRRKLVRCLRHVWDWDPLGRPVGPCGRVPRGIKDGVAHQRTWGTRKRARSDKLRISDGEGVPCGWMDAMIRCTDTYHDMKADRAPASQSVAVSLVLFR